MIEYGRSTAYKLFTGTGVPGSFLPSGLLVIAGGSTMDMGGRGLDGRADRGEMLRIADMLAIRTRYDGKGIHIPQDVKRLAPCDVIVLFEEENSPSDADWLRLQQESLAGAWDDEEDAVYDEV